ncbi:GNAT family N-acetyltransferase [Mesorhizobium sp. B2-4-6]|uniref:GNAT family N-acetyltransferase n=1 Tax=Mesorhizobium sp. B2-4-6 TaxID=2589943 RepID=UPI00112BAF8D|nr:GNAT family N-acetyltransferase [Mesorhizobium sp. B2-4-6]TPL45391.1 GNAT family N-acetyltransferase [Mesorhizobium sp. B2-4-6]
MAIKKRIKNLSKLTREHLAEGESERSDFKRLPDGISADDLVAFANSEAGGQILAGVDEQVVDKAQIGVVRGCDVSDATILQILNKAVSCIPPVSIDVYIENLDDKPILRVEVPPSQTKPHCTPKGVYCRRDGARNRPLHPSELLGLFLESEASAFAARFEVAAERITAELSNLESSLDSSIKSMSDQLGWADYQLGDTESTLDRIQGLVAKLTVDTENANSRLRALFRQDEREDPIRKKARIQYVNRLIKDIREDESLFGHVIAGGKLTVQGKQTEDSDITNEDAKQLLEIAVRHVHNAERDKKYLIVVKAPKACSDAELGQFAAKVADGGEVADGIRERAKRAFRLGFIAYENAIVGTAALKKPVDSYRTKVFKKAESQLDPAAYPYELGWIFLDVPHRGKGQMTRLINELLPAAKGAALFATTRNSNEIMRDMLTQLGFSEDGTEYKSKQNSEDSVKLFVRTVPEIQTSE